MSIRGVEAPVQRFKKLKKLGAVAIVAALIAAVVVGTLIFLGLMDSLPLVPKKRISFLGFGISPQWTVYLSTFVLVATIILVYVSYGRAIRRLALKAKKFWSKLPIWAKGVLLGLEAGAIAGLSVYLVGISVYSYPGYLPVLVGGAGWLLVGLLTLFLLGRDWELSEWARALNTGALIAGAIAVVFTFMFANVLPGYGTNVVFL
ncbi:MAG: hypothetical protein R3324_12040, partial [Halobacteriales archaeon]|nr:hypothetical protein [Halobacteriales archaeon]